MSKPQLSPSYLLGAALAVALASPLAATAQPQQDVAHSSTVTSNVHELGREEETITATVVNVDQQSRFVTLKGPKGNEVTIQAGPDVKNLDKVKPGDQVTAHYEAAMALQIMPANSGEPLGTQVESGTGAPTGGGLGKVAGNSVTVTAKLTAIDMKKHTVTLTGADGHERVIQVKDPERQAQMNKLKVGDVVAITYVEALAVTVTPKGKAAAKPKE